VVDTVVSMSAYTDLEDFLGCRWTGLALGQYNAEVYGELPGLDPPE
jgi:hypothetical protein